MTDMMLTAVSLEYLVLFYAVVVGIMVGLSYLIPERWLLK